MHEFEKSKEKRPKKKKKEKRTTHQILAAINSTSLDTIITIVF
jgi:ribosomal protein S11